jgi:hypothetical protein
VTAGSWSRCCMNTHAPLPCNCYALVQMPLCPCKHRSACIQPECAALTSCRLWLPAAAAWLCALGSPSSCQHLHKEFSGARTYRHWQTWQGAAALTVTSPACFLCASLACCMVPLTRHPHHRHWLAQAGLVCQPSNSVPAKSHAGPQQPMHTIAGLQHDGEGC